MEKQVFTTVATPQAKGDEPSITISTIALDRDRDEVVPEGGDFNAYRKNPVVLFGHDRSSLPVGSTTGLEVLPGRGIKARWLWLEGDAFAARVRNAFEQGMLRAASIGFLPKHSEPNGQGGRRFSAWELIEWSLVPLPANADAVRNLKSLGLWLDDDPVLEIDDADTYTCEQIATAYAELGRTARQRRSEPFEPVFDVSPADVRNLVREVYREALAAIVRDTTATTIARMRGRVD
jgi:hypothetical protein